MPVGTAAFQTFDFTGFDNLISVDWGQPQLADGLHQFANIHLGPGTAAVPEPGAMALLAGLLTPGAALLYRRRKN